MDNFDKLIKEKIKKENWNIPSNIDEKIMKTTGKLESNKKSKSMHKILAVAAIILIATSVVGKGVIPSAQEVIKSFVSYFEGKSDSVFSGDMEAIDKFNKSLGVSTYNNGIKVTLDNILVDDNYIMSYYTVVSDEPVKEAIMTEKENKVFFDYFSIPFIEYTANDETLKMESTQREGYFVDDNTFKYVVKEGINTDKFKDAFNLKILINSIFDVKGEWVLETGIDKSEVKKNTIMKNLDLQGSVKNLDGNREFELNKVSISPLGSKIYYDAKEDLGSMKYQVALKDDKGMFLDIVGEGAGEIEFLNKDEDIKYIDMIPVVNDRNDPFKSVVKDLGSGEIVFEGNDKGKLIVESVDFDIDRVSIKYRIEGYFNFTNEFSFYDKDGNSINSSKGGMKNYIDRSNNTYTTTYISYSDKEDFSKYAKIGICTRGNVEFDEANSLRIPLN